MKFIAMRITRIRGKYKIIPLEMDSPKEEEGPGRTPAKGVPSILYFIDNIPGNPENLKFEVISHFQKRKRFNGGEVVEKEYQALGPNSALLLFESAEEVSGLQDVAHYIRDQQLELRPLVKELVTLKLGRSSFIQQLMSSEQVAKLIKEEELVLTKGNNDRTLQVSGNWISVEQFRQKFQQFMITELQSHGTKSFSTSFGSTGETTESSVDSETKAAEDAPPDDVTSAKGSSLNPDVLALMQKTGAYQNSALSYDLQTATINVNCDDPTEKEKIKEGFYTAYQELMMGGKLKEHTFPVDDAQQANAIVDEYTKTFSHTYFRYDPEKKEIKCLSTDARQMQNVRRRLNSIKKTTPEVKSVCIDLPKLSRRVTIKFGDITEEEVDIIVNAANDRLAHAGGVAAAIDRASYGIVQQESSKLIQQTGTLPTGRAVITTAGGKLKCKFVIHAVGPIASLHKDQCGPLLHKACVNSMIVAQRYKAKSISFPPISSGIFGVSKELVANVMLSSLCSYTCSDPELLNDVRIVIIDEPTFDVFLKFFDKEKENLKLLHAIPTENSSMTTTTSHHGMQSESTPQLGPHKGLSNIMSIDLPNLSRRVILKLGDIVEEEVDTIVNSANMHLLHDKGVAAAINKASGGIVQRESRKVIHSKNMISTGNAVATAAGGTLKCKFVIHAVGPIADLHKNQCALLLKNACINAMKVAANFKAYSIAFPPIGSGNSGVSADLVADVMLSTLCSYPCSNPTLLSDVRIVIIDKRTFEVFSNAFHRQQQSSEQVHNDATATASFFKPPIFQYPGASPVTDDTMKVPGHVQPVLYSQAVTQQPHATWEIINVSDAQPTNSPSPSSQTLGQAMPGIPGDTSFDSKKVPDSSPITSKPKHDPNDPDDIQDNISNPTQVQGVDSSNATSNDTNADDKNISKHKLSIKSVNDGDIKDNKHSEDTPIDSFKELENKGKAVSNDNTATDENGESKEETISNDNTATNDNEENKEERVSNDFAATNTSSGNGISVDPVLTNSDLKPAPNNTNLQPASTDPLNLGEKHKEVAGEQNGPSPEASQDGIGSSPKQNNVSVTLHSKHLPPPIAADDKQNSSQKEQNSKIKDKGKENKNDNEKTEACPICFDKVKDKPPTAVTTCKHCKQVFCKGCLDEALEYKPYCPTCTVPLRKITGNQPTGATMTVHTYQQRKLPGYGQYGTIQINYYIPSGRQGKEHPNPGHHFTGTSRTAYLPDSPDGRKVLRLLRKAFDARLIFTVGTSHTSGATDTVVWNDIHHKTSMSGGPTNYGYPDPTYLGRVLEELAAKGITE